jgi:vanillate O-demethylase monooxygenase subunit
MAKNFVRNAWYVAATAAELGRSLLGRTLLGVPVVMYRKEDGTPVALEDRCGHRFIKLSLGRLIGDRVQCGYHGLEYDCAGACVRVPGQVSVPRAADIRAFLLVERWNFIWIWMGDAALADASLIPDLWKTKDANWATIVGEPLAVRGEYLLLIDNLLDPSHVSFVHHTTLGTAVVADIPQKVTMEDGHVRVTRWVLDSPPAPIYAKLGKFQPGQNVDRWQIMTFTAPSMVEVDMGSCLAGTGAQSGDRSKGIELRAYNLVTPETEETATYFWTHVRNFALGDESVSSMVREQFLIAFHEDLTVIEGVRDGLKRYPHLVPVNLAIDGGPNRARHIVDRLIAAESARAAAAE